MRLLIVSPALFGSGTGAATYYRLLAEGLGRAGVTVGVISDGEPGEFAGTHFPLFPRRVIRDKRLLRDALALLWQQALYARIPGIVRSFEPDTLLVHDSFLTYPGSFEWTLRYLGHRYPDMRLAVDVRGRQLREGQARKLTMFDTVIACSENVADFVGRAGVSDRRVSTIPVLQEPLDVDLDQAHRTVRALGLEPRRYLLYGGLLKRTKAVDLLIRAFLTIRDRDPEMVLALAGPMKDESQDFVRLCDSPGVRLLGTLTRVDLLGSMALAAVCANVSPSEGLPRFSLEALALGRPALLPPFVPEFAEFAGDFIAGSDRPEVIGEQLWQMICAPKAPAEYPVERHYPKNVIPRYLSALF